MQLTVSSFSLLICQPQMSKPAVAATCVAARSASQESCHEKDSAMMSILHTWQCVRAVPPLTKQRAHPNHQPCTIMSPAPLPSPSSWIFSNPSPARGQDAFDNVVCPDEPPAVRLDVVEPSCEGAEDAPVEDLVVSAAQARMPMTCSGLGLTAEMQRPGGISCAGAHAHDAHHAC